MAAAKTSNYTEHFRPEKLKEWPEPESVPLMEVLAREDIDKAVQAILFREKGVVKRLDTYLQHMALFKERRKEMLHKKWVENVAEPLQQRIMGKVISCRGVEKAKQRNSEYYLKHENKMVADPSLCGPLPRRQQKADEETRSSLLTETEKQYSAKEEKETESSSSATLPQFPFSIHKTTSEEWPRASVRALRNRLCATPSSEKLICAEENLVPDKEESAVDLSQLAFERQFLSSKLNQVKEAEKKVQASGTRPQRPYSWAPGDGRQRWGARPVERRVMTADVLGKHLASLHRIARQGEQVWTWLDRTGQEERRALELRG